MKIRQAVLTDLPRLLEIEQQGFTPEEAATAQAFEQRITRIPDTFLVAEQDGEIVGFINGPVMTSRYITDDLFSSLEPNRPQGGVQSILGLAVAVSARHQGIAQQLLTALENVARKQQRTEMSLTCKEHLIGFYEHCGYTNEGQSESEHGGEVWYNLLKAID